MAARPRSSRKRHWPSGLYERASGYFSWRNPIDGVEYGIGRVSFAEASAQAVEANLQVRELLKKPRLVDRLTGVGGRSVKALVEAHDAKLVRRAEAGELAPVTLKQLRSCARAVTKVWGERVVERVTTRDAAELLATWKTAGQLRMAQSVRSYLTDLFRYAEAEGWIPRGSNPVSITDTIKPKVRRARLSLDDFRAIYDAAGALDAWVRNAMALAIVSARRREDLAVAEFRQQPDSLVYVAERKLWVIQQKVERSGGLRLRVPFELTLNVLGWSLEYVIGRCRDSVVSRWLLHHTRPRTMSKPGDQVFIDTITKGFRRARERTGLTWPPEFDPPTFHEIRSLAARLYEQQGNVDLQVLLGHTDPATTELYKDSRGTEWADVKIA